MKRNTLAIACAATAAAALALLGGADAAHAFFGAGVDVNLIPSGSSTTEIKGSLGGMDNGSQTLERDDSAGFGLTVWGTVTPVPFLGVGLALHYLPTLEFLDADKTAHDYGSELDLNLLLAANLPVPKVGVSLFVEGGATIIPVSDDFISENMLDSYPSNDAAAAGFNVGGGVRVGYHFVPLLGVHLGLAYQYYSAELFKGSTEDPSFGTMETTAQITGNRIRLDLGVDFSF